MGIMKKWKKFMGVLVCDLKKGLNANKIKGTLKLVRWTKTLGSMHRSCFSVLNQ